MIIETNVPLQPHNSFGIAARAERLLRLTQKIPHSTGWSMRW